MRYRYGMVAVLMSVNALFAQMTWTMATESPGWSSRLYHTSLFHNNYLWLLGGSGMYNDYNDVWCSVDGTDWQIVTPAAGWSPRSGFASVAFDGKIWVLGGGGGGEGNDVWCSTNGASWTRITAHAGW